MKKISLSILLVFFLITIAAYGMDNDIIAVASEGKTASARVSEVAARSPYFLLFDGDGKLLEAVDNPSKGAKGGAATSAVNFLSQKKAAFVVAGEFGKNMTQAMKTKGIKYLQFKGSVEEALKKVLEMKK